MVRGAFTLIELIFAIVVMSIVMLSFPIIMQVDSDAREKNIAQEAALAVSAKLAQVLTYQWDERSLSWEDLGENHQTVARLLDGTNHTTIAFDRNASGFRASGSAHRKFFFPYVAGITDVSNLGDDNVSVTGIDDRNITYAPGSGFQTGFIADSFGYKKAYQMEVSILRVNDALAPGGGTVDYNQTALTGNNRFIFSQSDSGGQTNLRCARVSVQDEEGNLITRLFGYAANIGEYQVYSKVRQ